MNRALIKVFFLVKLTLLMSLNSLTLSGSQVGKSEGLRQIAMEVSLLLTCCFISLILRFISLRTLANT